MPILNYTTQVESPKSIAEITAILSNFGARTITTKEIMICNKCKIDKEATEDNLARAYRARRGGEYMKEWRTRNREWYNAYMRDYRRLNTLKASDANELMGLIAAALPSGLATEIKDEVMQELLVRVLGGDVRLSQIKKEVKPLVTKYYRDYSNRALLSLDAPIGNAEEMTLGELIEG